jgi:hypothetical protein
MKLNEFIKTISLPSSDNDLFSLFLQLVNWRILYYFFFQTPSVTVKIITLLSVDENESENKSPQSNIIKTV